MCAHGTTITCSVPIPAHLAFSNVARIALKPVDACLAPLIEALNAAGFPTAGACCGHGKGPAEIILHDGTIMRASGPPIEATP